MATAQTPGRAGNRSRDVNLTVNRTVALFMPVFLLALSVYASWVIVSEVVLEWFFHPPEAARNLGVEPRHGAGIAVIVIYFVLLLLWYMPYLRILYMLSADPGLIPLGLPEAEKDVSTGGLQPFLGKEMYVCEHGGAVNPRWCDKCRVWKPDRTHHCSEINRCVRRMDHFCPWVGGIVSETNYKFFIQFCFYAMLYTGFCVVVLAVCTAERLRKTTLSMNVHWAVILGVTSLFTLFTAGMFLSSSQMTLKNVTTIETLNRRSAVYYMAIQVQPQFSGPGVFSLGSHRYVIANTEPGDNPWDLGYYRNWCSVMGNRWFDWFLPLRLSPHAKHESVEGEFDWGPAAKRLMYESRKGRGGHNRRGSLLT